MKSAYLLFSLLAWSAVACAQPLIAKKKFYLFLLAGQSNMAGRGAVEAMDTLTHPRIWMLNKNNEWQPAGEPLHSDKPAIAGVGPGMAFARELAAVDSSICIGLIPCAIGGSPIESWKAGVYYSPVNIYPFDEAVKRTRIAQGRGILKGILWQQGESDSDSIKSEIYGSALNELVIHFRKKFKNRKLIFIAGTLPEFYITNHPFASKINEAVMALPRMVKRTGMVYTSGLNHKGDEVHLNSASARELGKRFASEWIHQYNK